MKENHNGNSHFIRNLVVFSTLFTVGACVITNHNLSKKVAQVLEDDSNKITTEKMLTDFYLSKKASTGATQNFSAGRHEVNFKVENKDFVDALEDGDLDMVPDCYDLTNLQYFDLEDAKKGFSVSYVNTEDVEVDAFFDEKKKCYDYNQFGRKIDKEDILEENPFSEKRIGL